MLSLKSKIIAGLAMVAIYGLLAIGLALSLPSSNVIFQKYDDRVDARFTDGSRQTVVAFDYGNSQLPAAPTLFLEEPDVLPTYAEMETFFDSHETLYTALSKGELQVIDSNGLTHRVTSKPREITSLPGLFWLQLLCGLAGMAICILVWIPAKREIAINSFAITGLSYVLFSSAAAIYSTRDFFIPGSLFIWLSGINHFGALLFSCSLGAFLWNYPRKAPSAWLTTAFYMSFFIAIIVDQLQLVNSPVVGFHSWVMGIFLLGLAGAVWQWSKTQNQPYHRSALRWVVISIVTGTAFFAGGMILPAILQLAQPASQGLLFTTFLLMYLGMALGVVRHRFFNLEPWWFSLWSWLLGGLVIMLTDIVLAMALSFSGPVTLTISVALIGWLYFPIRQYVWSKIFIRNQKELEDWLSQALPVMLEAQRKNQWRSGIEEALQAVFQPLSIDSQSIAATDIIILDKGESLAVPEPMEGITWVLRHAKQGNRTFTQHDIGIARLVLSLYQLVNQAHLAHAKGAKEERLRIRRDMHDDLGAKLLQLLHKSSDTMKPLVRDAMRDLRDLLKNMEGESLSLEAASLQWHEETLRRCEDHGTYLDWQSLPVHTDLSANQFSELTRILREAVTNALKHVRTSRLKVLIDCKNDSLTMLVENDGVTHDIVQGTGRGLDIMASRARNMGGSFRHDIIDNRWQIIFSAPLSQINKIETSDMSNKNGP
ncbi:MULTISPECIES: sensor histidine kinase [Alcanivorax]|uniref:sensor histidine kinase n=1 Tax=Alcanivorax TaxID=59753 RepID=UPI000C47D00B|nr:ATP-binding protein [Alcanivorax jadensis]MBG32209.1 sensor histidine kinase [Alcanivorax sp.]MDF1637465.1 sensor histidine kinase [Alcanivorax jadensis]